MIQLITEDAMQAQVDQLQEAKRQQEIEAKHLENQRTLASLQQQGLIPQEDFEESFDRGAFVTA